MSDYTFSSLELRLPGKVPNAELVALCQHLVRQVISVHGDALVYLLRALGSDLKGKSKVKDHLEWQMLGERHEPLQVASVINFVDYSLNQRAPAGHESAETPIGNESNGAVAGEGANFILILFRLVKLETPHNKELEVILNIMETTPEDQHSHHDHQDNPNEFRSMRDRMHPPRMSAPSCIVPPTEQLVIRPHIVPLLPTFHGMESENPMPISRNLKMIRPRFGLNSLRPRSIRSWTDLQAEFLKKFFPTHRTNSLKRQISNFSAKENEKFYECWERYLEAIMLVLTMALIHAMTRRVEELELKKMHEVQAVAETPVQVKPCSICQSYEHLVEECPTIPVAREMFGEQANVIGQFKPNSNASYGNTYNSSWRNHPNFHGSQSHLSYQ
ncbi:hypothetical protein CK203_100442 [Vitis vinifera]|uniref:Retrotransposon gag domain-containing protein n=1 Tax=Vitis vinifera TaxID=29760 RepID=A0A438CJ52_VITVI|nr:hypothetical protein CK203_100442 [Vitis vinifera]